LALFRKYNQDASLYRHALAVEAVMRHFAGLFNEDVEKWGIIGLIHDLDWEKWPEQHCQKTAEILTEEGWPDDWIRSVVSHGWTLVSDEEPLLRMEKVLYTIDELTGLITATALMRPSCSLMDLGPKSVKKKWSDKRFAAGVNREIIAKGIAMLGMERDEVIEQTIAGMRNVAAALNLAG